CTAVDDLGGLRFEWDPQKARANLRRHRVSFEEAASVFLDPLANREPDDEHSDDEPRWVLTGRSARTRLLVVSHTVREGRIRIISARRAEPQERRRHEEDT
ncbi:MAG: BrnT family toxin, partial [Chloroflexota bacterium]